MEIVFEIATVTFTTSAFGLNAIVFDPTEFAFTSSAFGLSTNLFDFNNSLQMEFYS